MPFTGFMPGQFETMRGAVDSFANQFDMPIRTIEWGLGDDIGLQVLQPFLRAGFISDPDFALGKGGVDIYDDMLRDPIIRSTLGTRKRAVSSIDNKISPSTEEGADNDIQQREATILTKIFSKIKYKTKLDDNILDDILRGSSYNEIIWKASDNIVEGKIVNSPEKTFPLNKQRMVWSPQGELRMLSLDSLVFGSRVKPKHKAVKAGKILVSHFDIDDTTSLSSDKAGYRFYGRGLGDSLWRSWYIKHHALMQSAIYGERYAKPMIIVRVPTGGDSTDSDNAILTRIQELRKQGVFILQVDPSNSDVYGIEYLEPNGTGAEYLLKLVTMMDDYIRMLILHQNLTSPSGGGTQGKNVVLNDVRLDIKENDIQRLEEVYNEQLIPWIRIFNPHIFDLSQPAPVFSKVYRKTRDEQLTLQHTQMMVGHTVRAVEFYDNMNYEMPPDTPEWITLESVAPQHPNMTGNDMFVAGKQAEGI